MLKTITILLKDQLNAFLQLQAGEDENESREQRVVFPDGDKLDPIIFRLGAVSLLMLNIEEENILNPANRYQRMNAQGKPEGIQPEVRLNMYVLFVANFKQYDQGLMYLSRILQYFQQHPLFTHDNTPSLSNEIEQLVIELVTLPFAEQNNIWNLLRASYHPSVLYRVKMLVYQTEAGTILPSVEQTEITHQQT
jgi:hypothetical protein